MSPMPPSAGHPAPVPALSHPATREALARYRQRCRRTLVLALPAVGVGSAALIVAMVLGTGGEGSPSSGFVVAATLGAAGLVAGGTLYAVAWSRLAAARRIEAMLASHPWITRAAYQLEPRLHWSSPPALVIHADQVGAASKHNIHTGVDPQRACVNHLYRCVGGPLLVAGDVAHEAVIATPDMAELATIRPYRSMA